MRKPERLKRIIGIGLTAARTRDPRERQYEVFDQLLSMGGLYVKFVQLLLLKAGNDRQNIDVDHSLLLKKTYDSTPYDDLVVADVLRQELGDNINYIAEVSLLPVAAGSFGQVYKAKLTNGQIVAIKVLRPSVLADINFDMRLLKLAARFLNSRQGDDIDLRQVFDKFESVTRRELDYRREADYANHLHEKYANHPNIVIPMTYRHLSTRHIITQDFIEGLPLTDVFVQKDMGVEPKAYVARTLGSDLTRQMIAVGQTMLESMLMDGTAHGDPHPGNIMLLPGDKVALLDFGICAQAPRDKQAFFNLVKQYQKIYDDNFDLEGYTWAMLNLFVSDLTTAIRSIDMYNHGKFSDQVFVAVNDAIASIYNSSTQDMEQLLSSRNFVRIFNSVINEGNRFGLKINVEQPEFLRATLLFISVTSSLGLKREVLAPVYTNVVNNLSGVAFPQLSRHTTPDKAATVVAEWLEKIASKDIYLYQLLSSKINSGGLHV
jgi:serine/threonine protein kinase